MAEEINLNASNLCTSEDAFDNFQAISMYETPENEFITLSDLVSPEPEVPDISNEIPYDNEVVVSSNFDDPSSENSQSQPGSEQQNYVEVPPETVSNDSLSVQQPADDLATPEVQELDTKPKRGRKKKGVIENNVQRIQTSAVEETNETEYSIKPLRRRGRKPKNTYENQLNQNDVLQSQTPNTDNSSELQSVTAKRIRKTTLKKTLDLSAESQVPTKPYSGRRGRPKKQPLVETESNSIGQTTNLNASGDSSIYEDSGTDDMSISQMLKKVPGRRGRPKKTPSKETIMTIDNVSTENVASNEQTLIEHEVHEINSESVIVQPLDSSNIAIQDINNKNEDDELDNITLNKLSKQSPGKRGRRKKIPENVTEESPLQQQLNMNNAVANEFDDLEDQNDEISLSQLRETLDTNIDNLENDIVVDDPGLEVPLTSMDITIDDTVGEITLKRTSKKPIKDDFEYNIDSIVRESSINNESNQNGDKQLNDQSDGINDSLLVEDTSKRPVRRKAKQTFDYDEGSDEDPFANMESSDDEPPRRRKGKRYHSDDEYVPGRRQEKSSTDISDSDIDENLGDIINKKRKRIHKKSDSQKSPKKRSKFDIDQVDVNVTVANTNVDHDDDIEVCLQTSTIKIGEVTSQNASWGKSNEFEKFIAEKIQGTDLKIKKVSPKSPQNAPLEIPVLNPEDKKTVSSCTQTNIVKTTTKSAQTSCPFEVPMKDNVPLTSNQSESACDFLKSIVKTTSELGHLMTEKSDDFILKKINTEYVTDTFKMDYCVRKSFLLLKLAKTNLLQMEEDLSNQYEEFLSNNNLLSHREKPLKITPSQKAADNDSDCEIVEEPVQAPKAKDKPKFNPKTVFLNKELSIKIAKKSTSVPQVKKCKEQLSIKGRHETVWINDSVMVKKVKPNQSFLAQDSRNKKPPDCCYVTEKMVSDFFKDYYRQKVMSLCAPFTSAEWLSLGNTYVCSYFLNKSDDKGAGPNFSTNSEVVSQCTDSNANEISESETKTSSPEALFSLCIKNLQDHFQPNIDIHKKSCHQKSETPADLTQLEQPKTLFGLSLCALNKLSMTTADDESPSITNNYNETTIYFQLLDTDAIKESCHQISDTITDLRKKESPETLFRLCVNALRGMTIETKENDEQQINNKILDVEISCHQVKGTIADENQKDNPEQPLWLSKNTINDISINNNLDYNEAATITHPLSLKILCHKKIVHLLCLNHMKDFNLDKNLPNCNIKFEESVASEDDSSKKFEIESKKEIHIHKSRIKTLFSLCVELLQTKQRLQETKCLTDNYNKHDNLLHTASSLKQISLEQINDCLYDDKYNIEDHIDIREDRANVKKVHKVRRLADICFDIISKFISNDYNSKDETTGKLTINSVNTLTEEAFHNIGEHQRNCQDEDASFYNDDDDDFDAGFDNFEEENQTEDNSWVSQVQMKEFKSCLLHEVSNTGKQVQTNDHEEEEANDIPERVEQIAQIKLEPIEEIPEDNIIDSSIIKSEPAHSVNEMIIIPESIISKRESEDNMDNISSARDPFQRQDSSSYDVDTFESFVRSNKMMHSLDDLCDQEEIFSQSALRIRRQHRPDSDDEDIDDPCMSLLVPQTFEPMVMESAKDVLMESSSDESSNNKKKGKKKNDKRRKPRKGDVKQTNKELPVSKEKQPTPVSDEVAVLTRRMRDKIRQEEKKIESSDSETENLPLTKRRDRDLTETENLPLTKRRDRDLTETENLPLTRRRDKDLKASTEQSASTSTEQQEDEIQCNNVDSTVDGNKNSFSGFSAIDQNEISSYQKYVKYVYDKIIPKDSPEADEVPAVDDKLVTSDIGVDGNRAESPLINYAEPVEMLECEPTLPIFDQTADVDSKIVKKPVSKPKPKYTERHGWHCYSIKENETKLYQNAAIMLEKLPETFVETYFRYQNITDRNKDDEEVDRLINLQSLNRSSIIKDGKPRFKAQQKSKDEKQITDELAPTSDHYAELTPSEDEGANVDDELPPPVSGQSSENHLAKNSLINDNDSDSDAALSNIKKESKDDLLEPRQDSKKKHKSSAKVAVDPEPLMLTADKMMNKELNLLHAPVVLKHELPETSATGLTTRNKNKTNQKSRTHRHQAQNDDDSSSEEEKQWVSTKEKLLKRIGKKQDTTSADDAKRAKLVTEFIERRADAPETRKMARGRGRRRRNSRKILEREKQLRVLSNELFGEGSDATHMGKKFSQSYFKGRRNIRKVIDKKSLARSTVISNMEEFERKRRLHQRQNRLRELLGCEEGVNVLVINDEVCLEYDFEEERPIVSVHPFFTKVMKAHQYEGVKFMWDACFESLEALEARQPGGGCILAHCMGLGKTLQVLALLHTVLTHPRAGMQRVLVCCPLSTVLNWVDEIHKWIGPVTDQIKVFELSKLKKTYERAYQLEDWYSGGGIFIIGYELFRSLTTLDPYHDKIRPTIVNKIRTALLDPGPDIIVCDEGHLLKNDCSVLAVAMSRVATKRRIVLTGTPMQNNLREYYCMVNFVKPNLLGTYSEYSNRFENPIMNGQHRDSREEDTKLMKQRTHILHKVLEGCLQRQEASVLYPYLPKKHEYTVFISLTKCQWDLYKHYLTNYANTSKQSILRDFHTLQKIWSHPQVLHNFQMRTRDESGNKIKPEKLEDDLAHEDLAASEDIKPADTGVWWLQYLEEGKMLDCLESSNKFVVVFGILNECIALGDKVLIFSTSLITMDALEFFLRRINKWSLGQEYYRLDGSVPPEVRQKWCREFNAEHNVNTKLFLISTRAGSLGLNMVAANRVIILDTSWNPAHDIQSIFRVYRFGQKKDCYIYRLVALGTMEQKIYERSVTKQAVACRVVDEQQIDRHYNMAELTELYKFDVSGVAVAGGVAAGVTDVALLRVARLAAVHAVHEHDSLLRGSSEQGLPEHERNAAWMQFQQEHTNKQMQNQLTPSLSLDIPKIINMKHPEPDVEIKPEVKIENKEAKAPPEPKTKKGKKMAIITVRSESSKNQPPVAPIQPELSTVTSEARAVEDGMVKKIMHLLIEHNFSGLQGPKEVTKLVSNVKQFVANGEVPKGKFNKQLTENIAKVLLGKESDIPGLTDVQPTETTSKKLKGKGKRGRPPKVAQPSTSKEDEPPKEVVIETDARGRRKAALAAEKSFESIKSSTIELDGDDDWQANDSPEEMYADEPEVETIADTSKSNNDNMDSILLSDDDEPIAPANKDKAANKSIKEEQVAEMIPLHPSLLSNKNFIKIVAHTYLEGNPMLDEDAATMAAQYSTLRALQEVEKNGRAILSGPIYDIAVKVLGYDILKKLNKTHSKLKGKAPEPSTSNAETTAKGGLPEKSMLLNQLAKPLQPVYFNTPKNKPKVSGPVSLVKPAIPTSVAPAVVPVGLFKNNNIRPSEPIALPKEESILPDDDDVMISDHAPAITSNIPAKRKIPPIIIRKNAILETLSSTSQPLTPLSNFPKIQISAGKIVTQSSAPLVTTPKAPMHVQNSITAPRPTEMAATICLDSDDEDTPVPIAPAPAPAASANTPAPRKSKRVALKSTTKRPVPVSLTASQHAIIPPELASQGPQVVNVNQLQNLPPNMNYVVIPPSQFDQFSKNPQSLMLPNQLNMNSIPISSSPALNLNPPMYLTSVSAVPQYLTRVSSVPQYLTPVSSIPQYLNTVPPAPQTSQSSQPVPPVIAPKPAFLRRAPAPSVPEKTTQPQKGKSIQAVCKPGDILRITKSGQVEILNRDDDDISIVDEDKNASTAQNPTETTGGRARMPSKKAMASEVKTATPVKVHNIIDKAPPEPPPAKKQNSERIRKISSSSSSSESSRADSPDNFSIFKDIVEIKSVEDILGNKPSEPRSTRNITNVKKPAPSNSKEPVKPTPQESRVIGNTSLKKGNDITQANKTYPEKNRLHKTQVPLKSVKHNADPVKGTTNTQVSNKMDVIDLVELDSTPQPSTSKVWNKLNKDKKVGKPDAVTKTAVQKPKDSPIKVVGTSKNIILSGHGKVSSATSTSSSGTDIRVTNVEKIVGSRYTVPKTYNDSKKRPAPTPESAPKKKKTEPMTLKDFNLDEIDDIIELE